MALNIPNMLTIFRIMMIPVLVVVFYLPFKHHLLVAAGINATVFQIAIYPGVRQWGDGGPTPAVVKLAAVLSISLWLSIIALGRLIAYWA